MDSKAIIEALEGEGWEVRSYSGRGMYGRTCLGVTVDSMGEALQIGAVLVDAGFDCDKVLYHLGKGMRTDSMGTSTILYWPEIAAPEQEDDEEVAR